jgi:hypothetical protein
VAGSVITRHPHLHPDRNVDLRVLGMSATIGVADVSE